MLQHDPCQNNQEWGGGKNPANFFFFVLFMFDFSSCCCELMASNAVLLRTFLPLCPVFLGSFRAGREQFPCVHLGPSAAPLWGGGTGKNGVLNVPHESLEHSRAQQRPGKAASESGHGAGFIKAASGGASWHSTEHNHSQGLSHQHPGQERENQAQSWTGVALKSSTLRECCPLQHQHRALCWHLLLVRTNP